MMPCDVLTNFRDSIGLAHPGADSETNEMQRERGGRTVDVMCDITGGVK